MPPRPLTAPRTKPRRIAFRRGFFHGLLPGAPGQGTCGAGPLHGRTRASAAQTRQTAPCRGSPARNAVRPLRMACPDRKERRGKRHATNLATPSRHQRTAGTAGTVGTAYAPCTVQKGTHHAPTRACRTRHPALSQGSFQDHPQGNVSVVHGHPLDRRRKLQAQKNPPGEPGGLIVGTLRHWAARVRSA